MQSCLYCNQSIAGHTSFLIKVEFPQKDGEIEIRDIGLACDKCIIDEGKPLIMTLSANTSAGSGELSSQPHFNYRCA